MINKKLSVNNNLDSSLYAMLTRLAKPFATRYALEDFHGNVGTVEKSGNEAHYRYTEMRLSELGGRMFESIDKDTVDLWFDNYDNTDRFPSVLPTLGYYNIVNGTMGISTGISSSIPQFNLNQVNTALIKLLWNDDVSFDEIYCPPDFASGGIILNSSEVKESIRNGQGKSCCIRSVVNYDEKENCLVVTEIPYGVYTDTISGEIEALVNEGVPGISRYLDLSGLTPLIKIYLTKGANWQRILKLLYKKTSLQSYFSVNMTMLDNGTTPRVFGWKEALQAHLEHEKIVLRKSYEFDLSRIKRRIHIINGLIIAIENMDEVVRIIRNSNSAAEAKISLMDRFGLSEEQTKAILDMKLVRLTNLEIEKIQKEKDDLLVKAANIEKILNTKELFYGEIEKRLREVMERYGDERRTQLLDLDFKNDDEDAEPIEKKELIIHYTNFGNVLLQESSTLVAAKRGGHGKIVKLAKGETIISSITDDNFASLLIFTNKGKMFVLGVSELPIGVKTSLKSLLDFELDEEIAAITSYDKNDTAKYYVFITKNGMIKKTLSREYQLRRGKSVKAINLKDGDSVVNVCFINDEPIGLLSKKGNFIIVDSTDINAIGRVATGVKGMNVVDDEIVAAKSVNMKNKFILSITKNGLIKRTKIEEFGISNRGIKGNKIQKINDGDSALSFCSVDCGDEITVIASKNILKYKVDEVRESGRMTRGVKAMNLGENEDIVGLL